MPRQVCDTISELAAELVEADPAANKWPEVLPFLMQMLRCGAAHDHALIVGAPDARCTCCPSMYTATALCPDCLQCSGYVPLTAVALPNCPPAPH